MAYVVSGCPRSGTSLMMDILRSVFGIDRILGEKFPNIEKRRKRLDYESDEQYEVRMYVMDKILKDDPNQFNETKDMNPNGFWEMLYTVQGLYYRFHDRERLDRLLTEEKKSICKIVSQGLIKSDPRYIDKIIYMVRHPRQVAKSQERLKGSFPMGAPICSNGEEIKIHSPEMYIRVTEQACVWLKEYSHIPVLLVNFDDLIENPNKQYERIKEFLGEGDFSKADGIVEPKLKRSLPEDIENPLWEDAEFVYDHFIKRDFDSIIEYLKDGSRAINTINTRVFCSRMNRYRVYSHCKTCRMHETARENSKKWAIDNGIDWKNEPCVFECMGLDPKSKALSIEESIKNNFWFGDVEPLIIPKTQNVMSPNPVPLLPYESPTPEPEFSTAFGVTRVSFLDL